MSTIPPFLCNTPPPIDFDASNDHEDDLNDFETCDAVYGSFNDVADSDSPQKIKKSHENLELPLPQQEDFPIVLNENKSDSLEEQLDEIKPESIRTNNPVTVTDSFEINETKEKVSDFDKNKHSKTEPAEVEILENDEYNENAVINQVTDNLETYISTESSQKIREGSPQSLELCANQLSEDDCSIADFQAAESKYDDNTSLPSLKFDSVMGSKSNTPVFEENSIINQDSSNKIINSEDTLILSALHGENTDEQCYENSDLSQKAVENDFGLDCEEFSNLPKHNTECESEIKSCDDKDGNGENQKTCIYASDSSEFDVFETFTLNSETENKRVQNFLEKPVFDSVATCNSFEADFSQFEDFQNTSSSVVDGNEIPFQKDTETVENNEQSSKIESNKDVTHDENESDDDFGEFSDFSDFKEQPTTIAQTTTVVNIADKVKLVIEMMFSLGNIELSSSNNQAECINENFERLSTNLNEIDSAEALNYQWNNSNVKHSLIKSLGIDSRNILYGEKWNHNIPRFAANLGFNPLEPLKPTKTVEKQSKDKSTENRVKPKTDVPAVEFDWNSSGLVNPLDASHAHTLLLDLDQLVVMANLDRLKLDSSSSPCSSLTILTTTPTTIISTTTTTFITANTTGNGHLYTNANSFVSSISTAIASSSIVDCNNTSHSDIQNNYTISSGNIDEDFSDFVDNLMTDDNCGTKIKFSDCDDGVFSYDGDGTNNIYVSTTSSTLLNAITNVDFVTNATTKITDNNLNNDFFNQYLDCRIKETPQERKVEPIYSTDFSSNYESVSKQQTGETTSIESSKAEADTASSLPNIHTDITTLPTTSIITNQSENIDKSPFSNNPTNIPTLEVLKPVSYTLPLKETHIFTPDKSKTVSVQEVNEKCTIDFDYEMAAAGIVINENVVKKEYRDIEYNPTKLKTNLGTSNEIYDEFHSQGNLQDMDDTAKYIESENAEIVLDKIENASPISFTNSQSQEYVANTIKTYSSNTSCNFKANIPEENDFLGMKVSNNNPFNPVQSFHTDHSANNDKQISQFPQSSPVHCVEEDVEDEFTDFQFASPTPTNVISNSINKREQLVSNSKPTHSGTSTPSIADEMILSPAVLLPQAIEIKQNPQINWPEPGITPEELARLEGMFPQSRTEMKSSSNDDDDDWSDFISVQASSDTNKTLPTTTGTQLSNRNYQYDDEWSDFVSITPPTSVSCVSDGFKAIKSNKNNMSVESFPNQQSFLKSNVPISYSYQGSIIDSNNTNKGNQKQNILNGLSSECVRSSQHQNLTQLNCYNNPSSMQQQQQQQHFQNKHFIGNNFKKNQDISFIPNLAFLTPKNISSTSKTNVPKK